MARKIVITSGKGGVGKTSVVANLGAKLSRAGFRVIVMDLDIGLNNLDVVCGVESRIVYDIIDVIEGRCRATQSLVEVDGYPNLAVLPSAHTNDRSEITGQNIKVVTEKLASLCDYILIDCPAGIESGFHRAVAAAEEALVVTTPHISSVRDADRVVALLKTYSLESISLIINRARGDLMMAGEMLSIEDITSLLKIPLLGVLPESDDIPLATAAGSMIPRGKPIDLAFNMLSDNVIDHTSDVFDCTEKYRGFLGSIRRTLRRRV